MNVHSASTDLLSDVLTTIRMRAECSINLTAGGEWSVRFPTPAHTKFNVVRRGACWLVTDGQRPVRLRTGDCLVVAGSPFTLTSDLAIEPIEARRLFTEPDLRAELGHGEDFEILGGSVKTDEVDGNLLLDVLGGVLVINQDQAGPIAWLLDQLDIEWRNSRPGSRIVCDDLLRLIFTHVLRSYLTKPGERTGWLAGLGDERLARVLHAIHSDPSADWSVSGLADLAGQSRSAFAEWFKTSVGTTPLEYVTRWKMRIATMRLRKTDDKMARIASDLGYASESAFGSAFRRVHKQSPGHYRRESR